MFNILIVEDNLIERNALETIIQNKYDTVQIYTAADYISALDIIGKEQFHLFLLDIDLKEMDESHNGISLGQYIRSLSQYQMTPIIFLTTITNKIFDALNTTHCYNYITKPYSPSDVLKSIGELIETSADSSSILRIKDLNGVFYRIPIAGIFHIETQGKQLTLETVDFTIHTREYSLSTILKQLPDNFIQCHKSHIINLDYVSTYDKTSRILHLKKQPPLYIPLGRAYHDKISKEIESHDCNIT